MSKAGEQSIDQPSEFGHSPALHSNLYAVLEEPAFIPTNRLANIIKKRAEARKTNVIQERAKAKEVRIGCRPVAKPSEPPPPPPRLIS